MPKRKRPEDKPEKQFERFVETARAHNIDVSKDPLEAAFETLRSAPTKPKKQFSQRGP